MQTQIRVHVHLHFDLHVHAHLQLHRHLHVKTTFTIAVTFTFTSRFTFTFTYLCICMCAYIYLSICLSIYLAVCLSIYLCISAHARVLWQQVQPRRPRSAPAGSAAAVARSRGRAVRDRKITYMSHMFVYICAYMHKCIWCYKKEMYVCTKCPISIIHMFMPFNRRF